ncbi:ABC transporter substrate-binding protein [Ponticoccus sp. SC2-23]|uniref:ABC transporter substrate-binding protein n=1 Tax=Alexandriicola marinus TaxID=2081710 RepID=UPI000FDB3285|nr:ABC transporter substrate-binding protein [Alexandriicola marinus]MBM1218953.1 ABC transporter substrate-binding protein [Ponticoccus sp. SC6-9]MBM1223975.1 ABC transporter substrate-binding protein [Ponticoccus sp. SC6-15]MBM1230246.1 ABC transporter substrate-binding protein [Ponticoccus sp. SC6-38]MBM1232941.1 ABC transporter substrate-binding protein [Ponticoccus sp. SC6-45]MBM1237109.1 ABC transporter substrate-binding protein [Ponticoccus sp. SC6-49]MBM1241952.1 ABC transporter subst
MSNDTYGKSMTTRRAVLGSGAAIAGLAMTGLGAGPARAQQRGGTFRVAKGHGNTTDTLDPATWTNGFMLGLSYGIHGYLTGFARDGSIEPQIAESWEASADASVWRFNIRQGVTFHDGMTLTPEHVATSINYHRGDDSTSAAKPLLEAVQDISIDGNAVVFTLDAGNADFPAALTDYHLTIMPPGDDRGIDWRSGNGCGPYRLVSFQPGVLATFARNTNDWDQNRGFFDEVEMLSIIDLNARTTALITGDVHCIDKLDLKTAGLLGRDPNVTIESVAGNQHYTFAMHANTAPFDDVNVRLALKYGINRQELVDKILFGFGSVGNDHPIGQGQRFFNTELAQTEYDPDRARFHLTEAGLDGLSVRLSAADAAFPGAVDAATLFQASAASAGIEIDVNRVPSDGYWSDVWLKDPFSAVYWGGRPTEDAMFTTAYAADAAWNDTKWQNARFNELLVTARAELDDAKRREMYYEMQAIVNQDGGAIIPMFASYVFALRPGIETGGVYSSHWDMDGERWMERWSFA